jgi:hypothetical protein
MCVSVRHSSVGTAKVTETVVMYADVSVPPTVLQLIRMRDAGVHGQAIYVALEAEAFVDHCTSGDRPT